MPDCSERQILILGGSLLVISSIYFPPVSNNFYLGQGTPNYYAVPTLIAVKLFSLASVLYFAKLQATKKGTKY